MVPDQAKTGLRIFPSRIASRFGARDASSASWVATPIASPAEELAPDVGEVEHRSIAEQPVTP
jgi:hypothetical protein